MGLDVYLHRYADKADCDARTEAAEKLTSNIWSEVNGQQYDEIPDTTKSELRQRCEAVYAEYGLDAHGRDPKREEIEVASPTHPDHYFKIGYWRSSYNDGGINNVLRSLGLPCLYDIVEPPEDEYEFQPDWQVVRDRFVSTLNELRRIHESPSGLYTTDELSMNGLEFIVPKLPNDLPPQHTRGE